MIKVEEAKIVKEVKRSDGLWRFACGDVFNDMCLRYKEIRWSDMHTLEGGQRIEPISFSNSCHLSGQKRLDEYLNSLDMILKELIFPSLGTLGIRDIFLLKMCRPIQGMVKFAKNAIF